MYYNCSYVQAATKMPVLKGVPTVEMPVSRGVAG